MIVSKITPIVNKTAEILDLDATTVQKVIAHTLAATKQYIENPHTKSGLRLRYFGVIRPYPQSLTSYLKKLIRHLRDPTKAHLHEEIKQEFRRFWNLRKLLQKDNDRRNFKQRFGS